MELTPNDQPYALGSDELSLKANRLIEILGVFNSELMIDCEVIRKSEKLIEIKIGTDCLSLEYSQDLYALSGLSSSEFMYDFTPPQYKELEDELFNLRIIDDHFCNFSDWELD